jgi:hypothetical protein
VKYLLLYLKPPPTVTSAKQVIFHGIFIPATSCNSEGLSAFAVAFRHDSESVAEILIEVYSPELDISLDPQKHGAIWHGLRSEHGVVREWARLKTLKAEAECFLQFIEGEKSSKTAWSFYLSFTEQLDAVSFMNEYGSSYYIENYILKDYDVNDILLNSQNDIVAAVLIRSIQINRLDIVLHIIVSTLKYVDGLGEVYWSPIIKIRKHLKILSDFSL